MGIKKPPPRPLTPAEIAAKRIAAGVCRHCGGDLPCWSSAGDISVGVKHPDRP